MAVKKAEAPVEIDPLKQSRVRFKIVGTAPMYFNAMSVKAKRDLMIGGRKKTAADKKEIKHNPEQEFYDSTYRVKHGPTLLAFPSPGIKGGMAIAALETSGITKTSVQRLVATTGRVIPIWGLPYLKMDVVRSADMSRTPDVRTRAFLPRWCSEVEIAFIGQTLSTHSVASLLVNAGVVCGLGDFRQEKGKGNYGTFRVAADDDEEWSEIAQEGREPQQRALDEPVAADEDTEELLELMRHERKLRSAA